MSKFNLCHIKQGPRQHGLNGYKEIIESVQWGLGQLGHDVMYSVNSFEHDRINIFFGAQVLEMADLVRLPDNSIVYHLEQIRGLSADSVRDSLKYCASRFQIWEYSQSNIDVWGILGARYPVKYVPIGYAPNLTRIDKPAVQDIDVLIYGLACKERLNLFEQISARGLVSVFVSGLYGAARDDLIARSKLIANVSYYRASRIFEIARVSYLLANRKAVVSELDGHTFIEDDIRHAVHFAEHAVLAESCDQLVHDEERRLALEDAGFMAFKQRDVCAILSGVVGEL